MSCLVEISSLQYDVCTTFSKGLVLFGPEQDHLWGGAHVCGSCASEENKTKLGWGKETPPGPRG